jgi:hypothetical protein
MIDPKITRAMPHPVRSLCLLAHLLLPALAGCSGFLLEDKQPLTIALHGGFLADTVEVWVDQELVYEAGQVTTSSLSEPAGERTLEMKEGGYLVAAHVNGHVFGAQYIVLHHPTFLGIDYIASEERIAFLVSSKPFIYF